MCGIVGIVSNHSVNQQIYDALTVLQHRGQDAAGMTTSDGKNLHLRKGNGLVPGHTVGHTVAHEHAHHLVAGIPQQQRRDAAVDPTGHGNQNP